MDKINRPYELKFEERELKSRRMQILLKPSIYEGLKNQAYVESIKRDRRVSINDLINMILEGYFN